MLSFATEFPINRDREVPEFIKAVNTWITGSPHTGLILDDLVGLPAFGEGSIKKGNESLSTLGVSGADWQSVGVRYSTRSNGLQWITTTVLSRTASDSWVRIQVSCEASHPAVCLPTARKPVLVRILLNDFGGASDGALRVGDSAVRLDNTDIDVAARLIRGRSGCRLPLVYVSADFQGNHIVDCDRLAGNLAGMAHVIVEPNRPFSLRLKIEVDSENVYGGTVGVYWPDGGGRRSFFVGGEYESPDEIAGAIFDEVRVALTNRRAFDRCTWAFVQESASRQAIQVLRASGSQEIDKYVDTFDKELAAKVERLEDAEREIRRLRSELQIYQARLATGTGSLLRAGNEQDLHPNEMFNIVRDAIEDAGSRVLADSRRQHVLTAILDANPTAENTAIWNREQLKQLLRGSKGMDATMRRGLEDMGFTISQEGKHYKLVFKGDDRYTFTLPKSGSDHRGGLNAASDIARLLF